MKQRYRSWFMLVLYCFTITALFSIPADQFPSSSSENVHEECKSVNSFDHFDHTSQWELQLKSVKENTQYSDVKSLKEHQDYFTELPFGLILVIETIGISEEKVTYLFSGTDIIFPFHNFW